MGDVTFLHDANGLVHDVHDPEPDLTIVVVNDDGGSIFATLEQGAPEHADRFDRLFGTPHGVDLASLCAATRTPHWRVDSLPELEQALASPNGGIEVVEVRIRRDNRRELDERIRGSRNADQAGQARTPHDGPMTVATDTFAQLRGHPRRRARRPRGARRARSWRCGCTSRGSTSTG